MKTSHRLLRVFSIVAVILAPLGVSLLSAQTAELRIGLVGLDTSHVVQFSSVLNNPADKNHLQGARVVGAFKGGSPDIEASASRVDGFTKEVMEKYGVKLYDSIEELARQVDALMIESNDGRLHLDQVKRALPFHKPLFIDKPFAASLRDVIEIFRLAKQAGVPVFTSSSLRFSAGMKTVTTPEVGGLVGALAYGPAAFEPHHPDLFWYGIHAAESLFTAMGRGCERVTRTSTADTDLVTGVWTDGRIGSMRGMRGVKAEYGIVAFGTKGVVDAKLDGAYAAMLREVLGFFRTGIAPVSSAETVEIYAFMEAAHESKRRGGVPVTIAEILKANGATDDPPR